MRLVKWVIVTDSHKFATVKEIELDSYGLLPSAVTVIVVTKVPLFAVSNLNYLQPNEIFGIEQDIYAIPATTEVC